MPEYSAHIACVGPIGRNSYYFNATIYVIENRADSGARRETGGKTYVPPLSVDLFCPLPGLFASVNPRQEAAHVLRNTKERLTPLIGEFSRNRRPTWPAPWSDLTLGFEQKRGLRGLQAPPGYLAACALASWPSPTVEPSPRQSAPTAARRADSE